MIVFHPNSLKNNNNNFSEINKILKQLKKIKDYSFIFSGSNIDLGGYELTKKLQFFCKKIIIYLKILEKLIFYQF